MPHSTSARPPRKHRRSARHNHTVMERGSIPNHQPGAFEPNLSCACKKNKQQQRAAHQLPPASTGALERHERTFGRLGTTQVMFMVVILAGAVQICQAPCGQLLLAQGGKRGRAMCTYNIGHPRRGRVLGTDRQRQAAQNSNRQDADDREFGHGGVSMCTRKIAKAHRNAPQRAALGPGLSGRKHPRPDLQS